jgi:signal transduction histidine kinase/ActR/RegA family two-component response regulator
MASMASDGIKIDGGRAKRLALIAERNHLIDKYRRVVEKYDALVKRCEEDTHDRSSAATLAEAALRSSRSGLALVAGNGYHARNARWFELAKTRGPWRDGNGSERDFFERAVRAIGVALLGQPAGTRRNELFEGTGPLRFVEVRMERVDVRGRALVTCIADDVTERVVAERDLEAAHKALESHERLRVVGELASGVAHDLNNSLHAITLRLARLRSSERLGGEERENVAHVSRIVADAAERVACLQEFGRRREDVPTETFDVKAVVDEALEIARPEIDERAKLDGVSFTVETVLPEGTRAVGSASDLRHVFVNLLVNARDAMKDGGRIYITAHASDSGIEVRVEDEGAGIAAENLERVFDPFFTTKGRRGVGMGLAVAASVMHRLGGSIVAANRPQGGAAFTFTFPSALPAPEPVAGVPPCRLEAGHRLLVVDDDADNLAATKLVLEHLGQRVDVAASGEEALALVRGPNGGAEPGYELVLCDVGMPGMNGWQLAEHIRSASPATQILMVSGWAHEIPRDDPKLLSVDGLLGKPLQLEALRDALATRLSPAPSHAPSP